LVISDILLPIPFSRCVWLLVRGRSGLSREPRAKRKIFKPNSRILARFVQDYFCCICPKETYCTTHNRDRGVFEFGMGIDMTECVWVACFFRAGLCPIPGHPPAGHTYCFLRAQVPRAGCVTQTHNLHSRTGSCEIFPQETCESGAAWPGASIFWRDTNVVGSHGTDTSFYTTRFQNLELPVNVSLTPARPTFSAFTTCDW
jgi:hypothetical protein